MLDNSIVMAWGFEDETEGYADAVLHQLGTTRAVVPAIWPLEVAKASIMGGRRERSTEAETLKWTRILALLPIVVDNETSRPRLDQHAESRSGPQTERL